MGGVAGKHKTDDGGPDPGRSRAASGVPGKTTLTAALDEALARERVQRTPRDVSEAARAEVGAAFGPRVQGVDYAVGAGPAEARDANAVTVAGQVDFAPSKFEVESSEGRARLGEETAHALQQSNSGKPSTVDALEGEAKQAGADFAAGRAPKAELAAPSWLALADDPKDKQPQNNPPGPAANAPSIEVPDLKQGDVTAINQVLATDRDKALELLLKALQGIDAKQFSASDLSDQKLHASRAITLSVTAQGPAFASWLSGYLDDVADQKSKASGKPTTKEQLTKKEVADAIKAAAPPQGVKDIEVKIGEGFFDNLPLLYSTVRHEFVHVQQIRNDYLGYLPHSVYPLGVADPNIGKDKGPGEVEAYLWEMEHVANTGLADPSDLRSVLKFGLEKYGAANKSDKTTFGARFEAAFKPFWKKTMDVHVAAVADQHKSFTTSGTVPDAASLERLHQGIDFLWDHKAQYGNPWSAYTASHKTAVEQIAELTAAAKSQKFTKLLDQIDGEVTTGYTSDQTAFDRWNDLTKAWSELDSKAQGAMKARFDTTAPALWEKTFDAKEAEIRRRIQGGELDVAQEIMNNDVGDLFRKPHAKVKVSAFQKRREALQSDITKARKAPKTNRP
jgi:hypothetical protein